MNLTIDQALQQGIAAHKEGKLQEADKFYTAILNSQPQHPDANHNMGVLAVSVGKVQEALPFFKKAVEANPKIEQFWLSYIDALIKEGQVEKAKQIIEQAKRQDVTAEKLNALALQLPLEATKEIEPSLEKQQDLLNCYQNGQYDTAEQLALSMTENFPNHVFGWKVLGAVLNETDRKSEALVANKKVVEVAPQDVEGHSNLGANLQELEYLEEAEATLRQAITLNSEFAEAWNNLGLTLYHLKRPEEAEIALQKSIRFKPTLANGHNNLGKTCRELGKLQEAKTNYMQAIVLKPDYAEAYYNFGILYTIDNMESALNACQKSKNCDPTNKTTSLMLAVLETKKKNGTYKIGARNSTNLDPGSRLTSNPLIFNRAAEKELISALYEMNSSPLDNAPGPRYGNGRCSPDYGLFSKDHLMIRNVAADLKDIMKLAVKSEIFIYDSFFNIYSTGAGIPAHQHLNKLDENEDFHLRKQKYSLVYYLSVGDQNCSEPGTLKLYDPEEGVLPSDGMIMIFPAERMHAATYGGKTDRIMIGANFYSL